MPGPISTRRQARQKPVPQEAPGKAEILDASSSLVFLPEGEAAKLCQLPAVVSQVLWGSSAPPSSFLSSVASRPLEYAVSHQHSATGETEGSPSCSLSEKSEHWTIVQSSLFPHRGHLGTGIFCSVCDTVAGEGLWRESARNFPTGFDVAGFVLALSASGFYFIYFFLKIYLFI